VALYWPAFGTWFQRDDVFWMRWLGEMRDTGNLTRAFFEPKMQGTVRFLGERLYFLGLSSLFGANPLPFHVCTFLTMFASMGFLMALVYRTTKSELAAGLAPVLWAVNAALAAPMTWICGYKEVLCSLLFLASLWQLERYLETGRTRYYVGQWITFLAGFGASEMMVVYPAAATVYCLCFHRRAPRGVLALWLGAFAFLPIELVWIHSGPRTGVYAVHFDGSMFKTFVKYWHTAAGPGRLFALHMLGRVPSVWLTAVVTAGVFFTVWRTARGRDWGGVFWLAWFALLIAPVLPLRDHVTDYLATLPAIGLAAIAARGVQRWRAFAVVWVGVYAITSAIGARTISNQNRDYSLMVRRLAESVHRVSAERPGVTIVIRSSGPLAITDMGTQPWLLLGPVNVRLTPGGGGTLYDFDGATLREVR